MIDAESAAYAAGIGNHGGATSRHRCARTRSPAAARAAVADLVGAPAPQGVVLGPSMTALTYRFAEGLARGPGARGRGRRSPGSTTTRTSGPWVQAAARAGATVRWADPVLGPLRAARRGGHRAARPAHPAGRRDRGLERGRHPARTCGRSRTPRTPSARWSTSTGCTPPRTSRWTSRARRGPVRHQRLQVVRAAPGSAGRGDPALLDEIHPDKLASSRRCGAATGSSAGTSPFAQHAGLAAAVDHLAGLAHLRRPRARGRGGTGCSHRWPPSQRTRALCWTDCWPGWRELDHVERIGAPAPAGADGLVPGARVCTGRGGRALRHRHGSTCGRGTTTRGSSPGCSASATPARRSAPGLSCYSDAADVDRLLEALAALRSGRV